MIRLTCLFIAAVLGAFAVSPSAATTVVTVPATAGPDNSLPTGIFVPQRAFVTVTVSGEVDLGPVNSGPSGVSGRALCWGMTPGLVGAIVHGNHLAIEGGSRSWSAPHSGYLSLYVNDCDPGNNSGAFTVVVDVGPEIVGDADGDTLDDAFEDDLLSYFAPHIKFDSSEEFFPVTAQWHARVSSVESVFTDTFNQPYYERTIDSNNVPFYAEWHIVRDSPRTLPPIVLPEPHRFSNTLDTGYVYGMPPSVSAWKMGHDNNLRTGEPTSRLIASNMNLGLYGRVAVREDDAERERVTLLYVQLFSYSNTDVQFLPDFGSHEGDWEMLELDVHFSASDPYASADPAKIRRVRWYAHGDRVEWLAPGEGELVGWRNRYPSAYGTWFNFHNRCTAIVGTLPLMPLANVPAHVQSGGHGFFPTDYNWAYPFGIDCFPQGEIRGNGLSAIPVFVANVGEVHRPRLGFEVITQYTGTWGSESESADNPRGVPMQAGGRHWPAAASRDGAALAEARYVGKWNHGRQMPDGVLAPLGRISWPHQSFADAVSANASNRKPEILVYPGNYPGVVTVNQAVTIRAPHGGVVIGQ